jgi:RNA polymerase sigma factor (sigma-70 family)
MKNIKLSPEQEYQLLFDVIVNDKKERLVEQYYNLIHYFVRKKLISIKGIIENDQDIELTNEVFIKLFDKDCDRLKKYQPELGNLSGWIIVITIRTVIDEMRKHSIPLSFGDQEEETIEDPSNYHQKTENNMDKTKILSLAKKHLKPKLYNVLKLSFEDYSIAEISKTTGEKATNCSILKWRAINEIKKVIQKENK